MNGEKIYGEIRIPGEKSRGETKDTHTLLSGNFLFTLVCEIGEVYFRSFDANNEPKSRGILPAETNERAIYFDKLPKISRHFTDTML